MKHLKGAYAPFSFCDDWSVLSATQRDDAVLKAALTFLESGQFADALVAVEYVCRRHSQKAVPALLRARLMQACCPEFVSKAWYQAYCADPQNPQFQDELLANWLAAGQAQMVTRFGVQFLPERCQADNFQPLLALLRQAGLQRCGACWLHTDATGSHILGRVFNLTPTQIPTQTTLLISDGQQEIAIEVAVDGSEFAVACPPGGPVWSVSFADGTCLQGSPLALAPALPGSKKTQVLSGRKKRPAITVLIPVYRGLAQVQQCLQSVLQSLPQNKAKAQVLVVDDASPEAELSVYLDQLATAGQIRLLRQTVNLGYLEAVNRGLGWHVQDPASLGRDVVLLNADAMVNGNWLDRLQAGLYAENDVASVTPWSNNGEISSFPQIAKAAACPNLEQLVALDNVAASCTEAAISLPSCCGFCMMMRASALHQVGGLDGVLLRRGYGEEVDWCLRASALGWRHMHLPNVFVAHAGGGSFGNEKTLRVRQNRQALQARYPDYYGEYRQFVHSDPLQAARKEFLQRIQADGRQALEWLQVARAAQGAANLRRSVTPVAPLPSAARRIGVWNLPLHAQSYPAVLQLARYIASAQLPLRLLVLGQVSEAMWHTGVVDGMLFEASNALLPNLVLLELSACEIVLLQPGERLQGGLPQLVLTEQIDLLAWVQAWYAQAQVQPQVQAQVPPILKEHLNAQVRERVAPQSVAPQKVAVDSEKLSIVSGHI